ncbi:MAG TPA: hypothetical protein VJJ24_00300, partial [Candidatus Paceibacterota bacterium]
LFKNSVGDNPSVLAKIQEYFGIKSRYLNSMSTGMQNEKGDVKMEFAGGENIDANIKAFKQSSVSYNQLTRTGITNFCKLFFNEDMQRELEGLFVAKARNKHAHAFTEAIAEAIGTKAKEILSWAFSYKESREILVIYERDTSTMNIYAMRDVFKTLGKEVGFTRNGNIQIGKSVVIQRKGGNGVHAEPIPKDSLRHPGNNVQIKLKMKEFINEMESILLATYRI